MSKIIYMEDRSGAETDDKCGMAYWWNRKAGPAGIGIVPKKEALALAIGRETHNDLLAVAQMEDIRPEAIQEHVDSILIGLTETDRAIENRSKMEMLYRRLGWFIAFALYHEPALRLKYETVFVEDEIILDREPLWVAVTPDRILRNRSNGVMEYREYKTTISASQKWLQSWHFAIQLHIGLAATSEELGTKVSFAHIMGLMKGSESSVDRHLVHPYVWGYYNHQQDKWGWSYEKCRNNDWVPMPVWEFEGGLVKWVQMLGPEIAQTQFPLSPPVFLNERMLNKWVARRAARQQQISLVEDSCRKDMATRELFFESRTNKCRPAFGDACDYLMCCWNAEAEKDPIGTGDYTARTPHHEVEINFLKEQGKI